MGKYRGESTKVKVSKDDFLCHIFTLITLMIVVTILATTNIIEYTVDTTLNNPSLGHLNKFLQRNLDNAINNLEMMLDKDVNSKKENCQIYLAPSSIPNSGFGLYAGIAIAKDEQISLMTGDKQFYTDSTEMSYILLHLKHNHILSNVKILDDKNNDKTSERPISFVASSPISVGEELFLDTFNLEHNFESISLINTYHDKLFPKAPRRETYIEADKLLTKIDKYIMDNEGDARRVISDRSMIPEFWTRSVMKLVKHIVSIHDEFIGSLFPESMSAWFRAISSGIAFSLDTKKRLNSLYHHAFCLDQLKLEQSTITNNKKGIFLTRNVAKDQVILSVPISIVKHEEDSELSKFCFHPQNSDVLICPLRFQGFVNHAFAKRRQGYNEECIDGANTYYRLSNADGSRRKTRGSSIKELTQNMQSELMIDYVAKRNIKEGEELTIDYGASWEEAFDDHHRDNNMKSGSFNRPMEFNSDLKINPLNKN